VTPRYWIVNYVAFAEGLVFFGGDLTATETLQEGQTWQGTFGFVNVSDVDFDEPLQVSSSFRNLTTGITFRDTITIASPSAGDTTLFTVSFSTKGSPGVHDAEIFVNPYFQPEPFYDNNRFAMSGRIIVEGESFNPVLDVTVDGRHIGRDEYVSAAPKILISLWDENKILFSADTTNLIVLLSSACAGEACEFHRLYFSDGAWTPATSSSPFTASFTLANLQEGRYEMRIAAQDASGNNSGDEPMELSFRIENGDTFEFSPPYPNPATSEITVELFVTGDVAVDGVSLELVNMQGKLAARYEIDQALHQGTNRVRLPIDEQGISSGLYVYRFRATSDGKAVSQSGKICIVR
jgi:hypothetical protein